MKILLVAVVSLFMGQATFAQKQITSINHEHFKSSGGSEYAEGTYAYDAQGRFLHGSCYETDDNSRTEYVTDYVYESDQKITGKTVVTIPSYGMSFNIYVDGKLENGLIKEWKMTQEINNVVTENSLLTIEYDAQNRIVKTTTYDLDEGTTDISEITWVDGNAVSTVEKFEGKTDHVSTHRYDMNRPSPASHTMAFLLMGMPMDVAGFQMLAAIYPYYGAKPANLVIGKSSRNHERTFSYEFDSDGDISRIEVFDAGVKTDVYILGLGTSGINTVSKDMVKDDAYYTLQGYRVAVPQKGGIYLRNGRKVLVK